ncbi:sensor histidine kinase [Thiomicrorhabdus arctica]|uniref:sensor histidine kinase n=1 Tax=Thiomicrorhabdus arctica TaxID=131540 RepID=UPI000378F1E0|nr:PAS domain-containing protein [Thiomicrorhabdus arctica]
MLASLDFKKIILASFLVFILGLVITNQRYQAQSDSYIHSLEKQFQEYSVNAHFSFQQSVQRELQRLQSLAMVFKLSETVSYQAFVQSSKVLLAADEGVCILEWVENVDDKNRQAFEESMSIEGNKFEIQNLKDGRFVRSPEAPKYAVIKYIYPLKGNAEELGLNLYSTGILDATSALKKPIKDTVASMPFKWGEEPISGRSILFYHPVMNTKGSIKGYVALVFHMNDFLDFVRKNANLEPSLKYSLKDTHTNEQPFATLGPDFSSTLPSNMRELTFNIQAAGRTWELTTEVDLTQLPGYDADQLYKRHWPLWIGLGLSLLLAFFTYFILRLRCEKKQNKQYLRDQANRYEELIEQGSDAFFLLNYEGEFVKFNSQAIKRLGYSKNELLGMNINQIDTGLVPCELKDICADVKNGNKRIFESRYRRKDGTTFPVEVSAAKFILGDKEVCSAFVRDLTDRFIKKALRLDNTEMQQALKKYTHELEEQKLAFEMVFVKSADGIFISEGRHVIDCNEATIRIFGFESKADLLRAPNSVFAPKFQPDGESSLRKGYRMLQICLEKGRHRYEWVNKRLNGEEFWSDVVLTRIEYLGRSVIHIAFREISKRKKLQAELVAAKEVALQANQAKIEFLAKISHEIRTPLHGILSYSQMGMTRFDKVDVEKLKRYFTNIETSADKLLLLFNDLLDASKLEAGMMRFDFVCQDLRPVIKNCVQEQAVLASEKQVEIILVGHALMAYFDAARVSQVICNLLSNAIRLTEPNKSILVKIEGLDSTQVQVTVSDEGPGILKDEMNDIFNQFVQSRQKELNTGGTGLGLAISREIISAHRSHIWAENRIVLGHLLGANFKFTLPIHKDDWVNNATIEPMGEV